MYSLQLRAMEPEDIDVLYEVENTTAFWSVGNTNVPYSKHILKRFLRETTYDIYADGQVRLMLSLRDMKRTVGMVDLTNFNPCHLRAEVGIIVFPKYQRLGFASQALSLLGEYGRVRLRLHQLYSVVGARNIAAQRLFEKAGYSQTARLNEWLLSDKGEEDAVLFQRKLRQE